MDTQQKTILITGASGLIGGALTRYFAAVGHSVVALPRLPAGQCGNSGTAGWSPAEGQFYLPADVHPDVVIHLAGENAGDGRWTKRKKANILLSRVHGAETLVDGIGHWPRPPELVLMASAVGFYGDTGMQVVDESSAAGEGFLASISTQVEPLAVPLDTADTRVVQMRLGVVMAAEGGALPRMVLPYRLGIGGVIGNGRQWLSWVSLSELCRMVAFVIDTPALRGVVNMVSPKPVQNRELARVLATLCGTKAWLPMPAAAVRLLFGEMGEEMLLSSSRVVPRRLREHGFEFSPEPLEAQLGQLL